MKKIKLDRRYRDVAVYAFGENFIRKKGLSIVSSLRNKKRGSLTKVARGELRVRRNLERREPTSKQLRYFVADRGKGCAPNGKQT